MAMIKQKEKILNRKRNKKNKISSQFTAIVLAAGKGKRMNSTLPKVLHPLLGKLLVFHVLDKLLFLNKYIRQIIVVVGYKGEMIEEAIKKYFIDKGVDPKIKIEFVYQEKMLGTANAVETAGKKISYENVLVLCGDAPLIMSETLVSFISFYLRKKLWGCVLSAHLNVKNSLGSIVRDVDGKVQAIREKIELAEDKVCGELIFDEVNSGVYCFKKDVLFELLPKIKINAKKKEYFLTDIIKILYKEKKNYLDSYSLEDAEEILGINTKKDLRIAEKVIKYRIIDNLIESGIEVVDPENTYIQEDVVIGKNTTIYPFTFIEKGVIIGKNCSLGPFIRLRKGTEIGDNSQTGNFLEINRSKIGNNVRIKHFGYLGDAFVEEGVNIGAGTVIANYDGKQKNKTYIGKKAFIGSDTIIVAPVKIGANAITGAGSVVTKDVEPKTVVVGVPAKIFKKKDKL
ncbi:MAG: bifunctional N-acetylglucosamine-1-phosphate uridyltransferase/glucosamine-1-phosphate acetyltransferase [Candidatus Omnitrophica bacterium]|nr:bifunctional N-acetylglucosamine-1-phosphate uridyltransferase/glucosamine-1-phosphate acetyltransferase [Candidatus Omnitrophota bacterium]